jgi:hypothetical protein
MAEFHHKIAKILAKWQILTLDIRTLAVLCGEISGPSANQAAAWTG